MHQETFCSVVDLFCPPIFNAFSDLFNVCSDKEPKKVLSVVKEELEGAGWLSEHVLSSVLGLSKVSVSEGLLFFFGSVSSELSERLTPNVSFKRFNIWSILLLVLNTGKCLLVFKYWGLTTSLSGKEAEEKTASLSFLTRELKRPFLNWNFAFPAISHAHAQHESLSQLSVEFHFLL